MAMDDKVNGETSARVQAQEAFRKSEEPFRTLVESSPNAVLLVAAGGTITLLNRQAETLFGYAREELVGQLVDILVPARFRLGHPAYRAEFAAQPQQRPMGAGRDLFGLRRDGSEVPMEIGLTPIERPEGLFVLTTITDITQRKRGEEELRKTAAELARSNEDLERFAHVVSHDLQEPLRVISQHLRIVRRQLDDTLDNETRQSMDFAVDAAVRMQAMVRGILAYARVGRHERGFAQTDMEAVLDLALNDLAASVGETKASIRHDPLPTITADSVLMPQLLQNLLSNAIKFCAAGQTPEIHIGAQREEHCWMFWVKDNGIGIDPDNAQRIFTMFNRLHIREEYPGTGIGLATCKRIVEYHGGQIWVDSRPGQGATFSFTIPDRP